MSNDYTLRSGGLNAGKNRIMEKLQAVEKLLQNSSVVNLHVNLGVAGVVLPDQFKGDETLPLNISYAFHPPDLRITIAGIEQTLSFGGIHFLCFLPWESIFSARCGNEQYIWAESMPEDLAAAWKESLKELEKTPDVTLVPLEDEPTVLEPQSEHERPYLCLVRSKQKKYKN